jgi:hypothetical protein
MINHGFLDVGGKDLMKDIRFDKTDKIVIKDENNTDGIDRKLIDSIIECIVLAASEMSDALYLKI